MIDEALIFRLVRVVRESFRRGLRPETARDSIRCFADRAEDVIRDIIESERKLPSEEQNHE